MPKIAILAILAFFGTMVPARAADISKGYSFTPTDQVTSTKLNNLVDGATINDSYVSGKTAISSPLEGDSFVLYSTALTGTRKCTLGALIPVLFSDRAAASNVVYSLAQGDVDPSNLLYSASAGTLSNFLNNASAGALSNFLNKVTAGAVSNLLNYATGVAGGGSNLLEVTLTGLPTMPAGGLSNQVVFFYYDPRSNGLYQVTADGMMTNLPAITNFDVSSQIAVRNNAGELARTAVTNLAQVLWTNRAISGIPISSSPPAVVTSQAHGLPGVPQSVRWVLVCTNADLNYAAGDEVDAWAFTRNTTTFETDFAGGANATTVWLDQWDAPSVMNKTTAVWASITASKWTAKVYLRYFYQ